MTQPDEIPSPSIRRPLPATSRYELIAKIATGGMATVYVGRLRGAAGFWRLCAIKRAHGHLVEDPTLAQQLIGEARLASRIQHPNIVSVADVEEQGGEILLVMEYIEGAALGDLVAAAPAAGRRLAPRVAIRVALDACAGLRAAHELRDDTGRPLGLVHRDVSPQNLLVGCDGVTRLVDFGIAKCVQLQDTTQTVTGGLKGKVAYMAPEYVRGRGVDSRADVFGLGVVLWEALAGARLFRAENEVETMQRVMSAPVPSLAALAPSLGVSLDRVLATALEKAPARRFASARAFAEALEAAAGKRGLIGSREEVAEEVQALVGEDLLRRRELIRECLAAQHAAAPHPATLPPPRAREQDAEGRGMSARLAETTALLDPAALQTASATVRIAQPAVRHQRRKPARWLAFGAVMIAVAAVSLWRLHAPGSADPTPGPPEEGSTPAESATSPLVGEASPVSAAPEVPHAAPTGAASALPSAQAPAQVAAPRRAPAHRAGGPVNRPDPNPYGQNGGLSHP